VKDLDEDGLKADQDDGCSPSNLFSSIMVLFGSALYVFHTTHQKYNILSLLVCLSPYWTCSKMVWSGFNIVNFWLCI
jgi:hypothetical protein